MKIKIGHFYQSATSSTVWGVLHIWPERDGWKSGLRVPLPPVADLVVLDHGIRAEAATINMPVSRLEQLVGSEVTPVWVEVVGNTAEPPADVEAALEEMGI